MQRILNKAISVLIVLCMLVAFSYTVFADEESSGTSESSSADSSHESSQTISSTQPSSSEASSEESPQSSNIQSQNEQSQESKQNSSSHVSQEDSSEEDLWESGQDLFYWTEEMKTSVENAANWLNLNEKSDTYLITMGIAGYDTDIAASLKIRNDILNRDGKYTSMQLLAYDILSIQFSGLNPQDYQGLNLMEALYEFDHDDTEATVSELSYSLIAYDSNSYEVPSDAVFSRENIILGLLEKQSEDGSFYDYANQSGKIILTAQAVTALSSYTDREDVKQAVKKALRYFMEQQDEDGGFSDEQGSKVISSVIIAISSLEIAIDDSRFVKNDNNLIDQLLDYQSSDGGFASDYDENSDVESTEYAIRACIAVRHRNNPYIQKNNLNYTSTDKSAQETDSLPIVWIVSGVFVTLITADGFVVLYRRKKATG